MVPNVVGYLKELKVEILVSLCCMQYHGMGWHHDERQHVLVAGTMTGKRYINEIFLSHVHLFLGVVGEKFVFMGVSPTCDRTDAIEDYLNNADIQ
ncbi:hypothetical protein TNCV_1110661 [Trichonephila clavipes]|nr:hypothetical protein TNCV_1110661 [Trichonephila clavipes]